MPKKDDIKFCVLLIATRKYKQFLQAIITQLDNFLLPDREISIMVFSDEQIIFPPTSARTKLIWTKIGSYGWPYATLYRYKIFSSISEYLKGKFTHLLYLDVDMKIVDIIGDEIIVDGLLAVQHPGMYDGNKWGSPNNSEKSTSWFPAELRKKYYCGGVQGGSSKEYLTVCKEMAKRIDEDEKNKVMAEWHDETHWNKVTNYDKPNMVTSLPPSYCMPEPIKHRMDWGLSSFEPKIIALDKDHKAIRS